MTGTTGLWEDRLDSCSSIAAQGAGAPTWSKTQFWVFQPCQRHPGGPKAPHRVSFMLPSLPPMSAPWGSGQKVPLVGGTLRMDGKVGAWK